MNLTGVPMELLGNSSVTKLCVSVKFVGSSSV
jgi:hypothetical protein